MKPGTEDMRRLTDLLREIRDREAELETTALKFRALVKDLAAMIGESHDIP